MTIQNLDPEMIRHRQRDLSELFLASQQAHRSLVNLARDQDDQDQASQPMMTGIAYLDAKPDTPTTLQSIQEMDITELSNSLLRLGEVLAELDYHMNTLTTFKERLLRSYGEVLAGANGLAVVASLVTEAGQCVKGGFDDRCSP